MKKYRIQFPTASRPRAISRERLACVALICLRYRDGVSYDFLGPVESIMKQYGVSQYEIAEPDCLFIAFTQITHKEPERTAKRFYEHVVNAMQDLLIGAGYAQGEERLFPDETGRSLHAFPDGDVCRDAYKRSFGDNFSKF